MPDQDWWPHGVPPVVRAVEGAPLTPRAIAEALEYRELFNKHQEQQREEARETDTGLEWRIQITPDYSCMSDERREAVETEIASLRADPEVRAGLRRRLQKTQPELARLMDDEGSTTT